MDEQASFEPRAVLTPRRGRGNAMGLALVALVVAGILGAGVLGRLGAAPSADALGNAFAPAASAPGDVAVAPTAAPPSLSNYHPPPTLPRYPGTVLGLQVWSAAYVSKYGLNYFSGSIAVSGWYAAQPDGGCPTPRIDEVPALAEEFGVGADADTFCHRAGSLFTAPIFGEMATPIAIELRPGVAAPYDLNDVEYVTPVVVVGRLTFPEPTCQESNACQSRMVVDHVAWASGAVLRRTSSVLPRLLNHWPPLGSEERDSLSTRALGFRGNVLLETLVDPATLERIDPHVAEIVAAAAPDADRIWYRRVLGADPTLDPMHWVAIDDATAELIATGFER